ncbi:MAG: iron-only hydrogenase system regulator [Eubacteriaceae bacterium]|jgi:putative iron-only hydrogenase system regulator|nr:iron-only hydrogenase system regulator [Eubacteriaceae bacterium]
MEETRVAILGIIVNQNGDVEQVNQFLHEYGQYIIGRIGIPYRKRGISIIGIVLDAPQNEISTLSGKLGRLEGINVKVTYSNV